MFDCVLLHHCLTSCMRLNVVFCVPCVLYVTPLILHMCLYLSRSPKRYVLPPTHKKTNRLKPVHLYCQLSQSHSQTLSFFLLLVPKNDDSTPDELLNVSVRITGACMSTYSNWWRSRMVHLLLFGILHWVPMRVLKYSAAALMLEE